MKSKTYLALLLFTILLAAPARAQDTVPRVEDGILRLNLLFAPKIEGEFALSQNATLGARLGTELALYSEWLFDFYVVLLPSADVYYRYYYNLDRRTERGKRIYRNSGNYVGLTALYASGNPLWSERPDASDNINHVFIAGPVYGLQRTYGKGFYFVFEVGLGYGYEDDDFDSRGFLAPISSLRLGWAFGL